MQTPDVSAGITTPLRSIEEYRGRTDPEAIKAAAQEMEAMFAYELMKAMRSASNTSSSQKGLGANTYTSLFDMEISKLIAKRGIGLKDMLLKGIEKQAKASTETDTKKQISGGSQKLDESADVGGEGAAALPNSLPVSGGSVSSSYGMRPDPFTKSYKFHHGVDIAAPEGSDVRPVKQGTVIFSGEQKGYGNVVVIDHDDGYTTKYAHNQLNLVKEGDVVTSNTVIARVGHTGRSTGPHVHFEISYNGTDIDPAAIVEKKV
jgi:murein DD-endopeptidase MepM/ murein hydrolase activator NlpD